MSLRLVADAILKIKYRIIVTVFPLHTSRNLAVGRLKKSTILAFDLELGVSGEALKAFGTILDRIVVLFCVADNKGAR